MHDPALLSPASGCHATPFNTSRPEQNGRHFADDTFKYTYRAANICVLIDISLKCVPEGPIYKMSAVVQVMACRRSGDKPLLEPMMIRFADVYIHHEASIC